MNTGTVECIPQKAGETYPEALARVREKQWQTALGRARVMRAELVRLGCTDPAILGSEIIVLENSAMAPPIVWKTDAIVGPLVPLGRLDELSKVALPDEGGEPIVVSPPPEAAPPRRHVEPDAPYHGS